MKLKLLTLLMLMLIFVVNECDVEARGGRGGGGGGRGGGSRGGGGGRSSSVSRGGGSRGGSVNRAGGGSRSHVSSGNRGGGNASRSYSRAPTMSRSEVSRSRPSQLPSRSERPSSVQRPSYDQGTRRPVDQGRGQVLKSNEMGRTGSGQNIRPGEGIKAGQGVRAGDRGVQEYGKGDIKQHLQNAQGRSFDKGTLDQKRQEFKTNHGEYVRQGRVDSDKLRNRVQDRWHDYNHWFGDDFYRHHDYHPNYWHDHVNWWGAATWVGLAGWLSWGGLQPVYYEDGYYPIETAGIEYTTQDSGAVVTGQVSQAPVGDWYPLGVFAVGKDAELAENSHMFVQLAINKDGELAGTYYNAITDKVYAIEGSVDQKTQMAAWKLADRSFSPVISTGLYNLTQSVTEVDVDFPDGTEQTWTYVRLAQQ